MTAFIVPVILQLLATAVVIAEFVLPSLGLLTVMALALFGYSLYIVFSHVSPMAGFVFLAFDICLIPVVVIAGIKLLASSPVTLRTTLDQSGGAMSQPPQWAQLVGKCATAVTDLRPAGAALIEGQRYDVVSMGDFIVRGSALDVVSVEGNRIVVKTARNCADSLHK